MVYRCAGTWVTLPYGVPSGGVVNVGWRVSVGDGVIPVAVGCRVRVGVGGKGVAEGGGVVVMVGVSVGSGVSVGRAPRRTRRR